MSTPLENRYPQLLQQYISHFLTGSKAMIYFLHGKDTYRLQQKLKEIEKQYKEIHQTGLNLEKFDATQITFREFWDNLFQQSMFVKKKLFFLENVFSSEAFKERFLKTIQEISKSQDIIVLFEKKEIEKADKLFRVLKKQAVCQNFEILTGQKLKNWLKNDLAKYKAEIEVGALNTLIDFVGSDLWRLSNEVKKLVNYTKKIKTEDIELLVKPKIDVEIFKTIDALAQRDKKRALSQLQKHLDKGDSPFYLLKMFAWQFRNLLLVKSGKPSNMHPFVFRKTLALARGFSSEQLKKIYHQIFEADLNIKTGKINPEEGLRMLIVEI